ncbi:hypothetical protein MLD38_032615 [Melastoma candidum]|uniref:Uncharacterized protein n=1 Tax=Melastoma candidum TaxID=119954 RepID=A0ACB9M4R9_9MYRT|nr:hypothetical protein MLD38_032615 [Melastoma candidum]
MQGHGGRHSTSRWWEGIPGLPRVGTWMRSSTGGTLHVVLTDQAPSAKLRAIHFHGRCCCRFLVLLLPLHTKVSVGFGGFVHVLSTFIRVHFTGLQLDHFSAMDQILLCSQPSVETIRDIDGNKVVILNVSNPETRADIVMSTGEGKPKLLDEKQTTIYKRAADRNYHFEDEGI